MADDTKIEDLVLIVHGIRDRGVWQSDVSDVLRSPTVLPIAIKYGRFDALQFAIPGFQSLISWFTREPTPYVRVLREIRSAKVQFPDARLSVIAHSNGTYVISQIIQNETDLKFWRVIFCGSVVKQSFRWDQVKERVGDPNLTVKRDFVLNECGSGDKWPAVAEIISFTYGTAGTDGFGGSLVTDRFHKGEHDHFLNRQFVENYWKPFMLDGEIKPGDGTQEADLPFWFKFARVFLCKTAVLLYTLLLVTAWLVWHLWPNPCESLGIDFAEFTRQKSAAFEKDSVAEFKQKSLGKCVDWTCEVVEVIESSQAYLVKPEGGVTSDHVTVRFKEPNRDFNKLTKPGTVLHVNAKMASIGQRSVILMNATLDE